MGSNLLKYFQDFFFFYIFKKVLKYQFPTHTVKVYHAVPALPLGGYYSTFLDPPIVSYQYQRTVNSYIDGVGGGFLL